MRAAHRDDGFDEFVAQVARPTMRAAVLLTGDRQLAEDLVQEALARVFRNWPMDLEHPVAYTRAVMTRLYLSHRRLRRSSEVPVADFPDVSGPTAESDPALRRSLVAALGELPPKDRAVVVLRYLADRSVAEVASDLGVSPGSVRTRCTRALTRLRHTLGSTLTNTYSD